MSCSGLSTVLSFILSMLNTHEVSAFAAIFVASRAGGARFVLELIFELRLETWTNLQNSYLEAFNVQWWRMRTKYHTSSSKEIDLSM